MNRQDNNIPLDDELQALEAQLAESLHTDPPAGLADRVLAAMRPELDQQNETDAKLTERLTPTPPPGLTDRVFTASVKHLPQSTEPVVGRIAWHQRPALRAAAVVAVIALLASLLMVPAPSDPTADASIAYDPIDLLLASADSEFDQGLDALESELFALTTTDAALDSFEDDFDDLFNTADPS